MGRIPRAHGSHCYLLGGLLLLQYHAPCCLTSAFWNHLNESLIPMSQAPQSNEGGLFPIPHSHNPFFVFHGLAPLTPSQAWTVTFTHKMICRCTGLSLSWSTNWSDPPVGRAASRQHGTKLWPSLQPAVLPLPISCLPGPLRVSRPGLLPAPPAAASAEELLVCRWMRPCGPLLVEPPFSSSQ